MEKKREGFKSNIGFILACIGSAVGMGNIWLFPYRAGEFGGAAFLIPYIFFCCPTRNFWYGWRNGIWKINEIRSVWCLC